MGDQLKAGLRKVSNMQRMRIRSSRSASRKSEEKSEDTMDSDSQKSHKESRFARRISVGDKRSVSPGKKGHVENAVINIEPTKKPSREISRLSRGHPSLKRAEKIQSLDVEAGEDSQKPTLMNVVVDVHCENEVVRSSRNSQSPFSPSRKSDENSRKGQVPTRLSATSKKQEIEDLTESIQESPSFSKQALSVRPKESKIDLTQDLESLKKKNSGNEEENKTLEPPVPKTRRRKRWEKLETVYVADDPKKVVRNPWTQEVAAPPLRKGKAKSSWDTSSGKEDSPRLSLERKAIQEQATKPVPAPRRKSRTFLPESSLAFDNEAFLSDHDEVLRIETNQENAKIEMSLETLGSEAVSELKSKESEFKSPYKRSKGIEKDSSAKSETSDLDLDDRRISRTGKISEKVTNFKKSEEKSVVLKKKSFQVRKPIRSETFRKSGSEDTSNLENESISQKEEFNPPSDKSGVQSQRNSEEISSDLDNSQKPKRFQVIRTKFSGRETPISTNDESEPSLDQSRLNLENISSARRSKSNSKDDLEVEEKVKRKIDKRRKSESRRSRTSSSTRAQESLDEDGARRKKKKKKRRKEDKEDNKEVKFVSIIIHKCDVLEIDYVTRHPMVKVHIVNANTGDYLRSMKSEEKIGKSYLQPVITGKFDFKEHRSMIPVWEEELIFEQNFEDILKTGNELVLILFEVLDLLTFSEASLNYEQYGTEGCWYKIAWAFLRPVGTVGLLHINKKVRLQLYRPRRNFKKFSRSKCEVYTWWKSNKREKYPSSLFVTVSAVDPPKLEPVYYEQLTLTELSDVPNDTQQLPGKSSDEISLPKWSRLTAQSCKIPNKLLFETEVFDSGSFYLAFSNNGKLLACTTSEEHEFPIIVYKVDERKIFVQFSGHKNFVYSLHWSSDDQYLLSVSSDQTARIWDVNEKLIQHIQLLPHPSYVYCGKFDPLNSSIAVTGCYDHVARIWAKGKNSQVYELIQELEVHEGFVNSMCFQKDGSLLTADSMGVIVLWIIKKSRRGPVKKEWQFAKKIKLKEIEGVPINTIVLHPRGSRLLVHSRNNGLRLLDLATGVVLQQYQGLQNKRIQTAACISPCAGLVFCGGEDSTLNVWNLETGKHLAKYTINDNFNIVSCVDYHPYDHVLAFSTFGGPASLKLLVFDKDSSGESVGLHLLINVKPAVFTNKEASLHPLEKSRTKALWSSSSQRRSFEESVANLQTFNSGSSRQLSNFGGSTGRLIENEDDDSRKENLKMKLQRFMESGPNLKTRSMNRLNNIIEKIDKILLNASSPKSPVDLETASSTQTMTLVAIDPKMDRGKGKLKPVVYKNHSDNALNSTPTDEGIEMQTFTTERKSWKERSRSAKALRSPMVDRMEEEQLKTFSDSAVICRGNESFHKADLYGFTQLDELRKKILSQDLEEQRKNQNSSSSGSVVVHQYEFSGEKRPESPGSDGTYVLEKSDLEKNENLNSEGAFGSGSSIRSNVTFTVVSEVAAPKPRKKKSPVQ